MSLHHGRTFGAVAVAVVSMLCASVSYAQAPSSNSASYIPQCCYNTPSTGDRWRTRDPGSMYVACRAEVPSNNTEYFSAMYQASAVSSARKEFRQLVTTQYGAVSQVQCVGKFNPAVVKDTVQQWQDKARATSNAIVETGWYASTAETARLPSRVHAPSPTFRAATAVAP